MNIHTTQCASFIFMPVNKNSPSVVRIQKGVIRTFSARILKEEATHGAQVQIDSDYPCYSANFDNRTPPGTGDINICEETRKYVECHIHTRKQTCVGIFARKLQIRPLMARSTIGGHKSVHRLTNRDLQNECFSMEARWANRSTRGSGLDPKTQILLVRMVHPGGKIRLQRKRLCHKRLRGNSLLDHDYPPYPILRRRICKNR